MNTRFESLAARCPVVATAVDGTPEVVVNGQTGLTVPPGDSAQLGDAICLMLHNPEIRHAFGRQGRMLVEAEFNQAKQIRETEDLYQRALGLRQGWVDHTISNSHTVSETTAKTLVVRHKCLCTRNQGKL